MCLLLMRWTTSLKWDMRSKSTPAYDLWECFPKSWTPYCPPCAVEIYAEGMEKGEQGNSEEAQNEAGPAGTPEKAGVRNARASCFILSSMKGPEGNRGMWESCFLLCLANGTSSSFYA